MNSSSKNPCFSYNEHERFDINYVKEPECKYNFRFEKRDIPLLADVLHLPDTLKCEQRTTAEKIEALCILLKRTAYPCRYNDMIPYFGRSVPELSMITNAVVDYIYDNHGHRVTEWNDQILAPAALETYADAIHMKEAVLDNCFGFVDGTVRPICRPEQRLEQYALSTIGEPMCIYRDPAYPLRVHLQSSFRDAGLTSDMVAFNKTMSAARVSVEWIFGEVINSFKFMDFKNNLKTVYLSFFKSTSAQHNRTEHNRAILY